MSAAARIVARAPAPAVEIACHAPRVLLEVDM